MAAVGDIEQMPSHAQLSPAWEAAHSAAVDRGEMFYEDPDTGLMVMTELVHRKRGRCCGSGCRHCPFAHESVPAERRQALNYNATWLVSPDVLTSNNADSSAISTKASSSQSEQTSAAQPVALNSPAPAAEAVTVQPSEPRPIVVLFWSTGKDSFLALRALQRTAAGNATPMDPPVNVRTLSRLRSLSHSACLHTTEDARIYVHQLLPSDC